MDSRSIDSQGPFKRSNRMPLDAVVRLHFEGTVAYQNGFAANVSATGMFVKHPDPPTVGTRLVFEFVVGLERRPVQGAGVVAWVREKYEGPGRPAGIGIQFTEIDAASRQHIAEALFEYLEASLGGEDADEEPAPAAPPGPGPSAPPPPPPIELQPLPPELAARLTDEEGEEPLEAQIFVPPPPAAPGEPGAVPPPVARPFTIAPAEPRTVSFAAAEPAPRDETEEERIDRLVRSALADEEPYAAATARAASSSESAGRGRSIGIAAAAAILLAAGGWAVWKYVLLPAPAEPPASSLPAPEPEQPTPTPRPVLSAQPDGTLAETVGATDAAETAPEPPLPTDTAGAAATGRDETGEPEPIEPVPESVQVPVPAPAAAPPEPAVADAGPGARALTDIEWTEATGITVVTLTGDGTFAPGSYSYSEIGGENPRVLVRFKSLASPYRRGSHTVGTAAVSTIRTGWHERPAGHEQHVVLDLAAPGVRLEGFEALGSRLVLKLAPR